ncbi:hypothetical protein TW65_03117 [Stemphylium lycopersici]|uniref:Uncharacterized protein n=1 Tax=Stemphylium lycopersici TaxID=183478 RepID=A0A364NBF9_STELY|nr:hypothetical protein TW65_03117 [Stemphylium lycopersici]RAR14391.1 hypothetical protein DDE83_002159 [Stemphylium lycopersici]
MAHLPPLHNDTAHDSDDVINVNPAPERAGSGSSYYPGGKNAFDTPSKPDTPTSLACTTAGATLPPTPSFAIDSKSVPWNLERRADVSSDDANDEDVARPKSKRPCGMMGSMLDMYFDEASRPLREKQNQQGKKLDECVSTLADLSTRVTAAEKRSSDVHHRCVRMGTTTDKIAQIQHDCVSKKTGIEVVRHVEEQKDSLETLKREHQNLVTTVNEHKARLGGLVKKRVTKIAVQRLTTVDNTELKTSITYLSSKLEVTEKAAKALLHKAKSLETAGAGGLKDIITPMQTEVDALRKHVTSLQALRAKEEDSPAESRKLTNKRRLKLFGLTQEGLQTLERSHEQLSSTFHDLETKTGLSIASFESKGHLDMQSLGARVENTDARNKMEALSKNQAEDDRTTKEQERKQAEDKKQLRGKLDWINKHLQTLAQQLLAVESNASAPSPATGPRLATPKAEQPRNSHAETCKPEAYERLNQRVDSFWNLFSASKDSSESRFDQVERISREQAQRVIQLKRVSHHHSHRIANLRTDMSNRFDTAISQPEEGLQRHSRACVDDLAKVRTKTEEQITAIELCQPRS